MKTYSKESLIKALKEIADRGWIQNARPGNAGGIGNTLEDLLGITENNLPLPNAAEWELKSQRTGTSALTTLFHMEPSPRAMKFVPRVFLPNYGWSAGEDYPEETMSFRQTIYGRSSDRGFRVVIDRDASKVLVSFDVKSVDSRHVDWLQSIDKRIGLGEISPQPYWGFQDLSNKAGTKLLNCFYVQADVKRENGQEYFHYNKILMLSGFSFEKFLEALEEGNLLVDFDARTGHNHGTKFRLRATALPELYSSIRVIR